MSGACSTQGEMVIKNTYFKTERIRDRVGDTDEEMRIL
jgi:hypothetical protein